VHKFVTWLQVVFVPWLGAPGVFVVAFLDSSFLSLPEVNDLIVVMAAVSHPETVWLPIVMTTLGSLAGCTVLWWLGRRGGEGLLTRRFGAERVASMRGAFDRWNLLALAIPAVSPPPMPFKAFVIAAGVFGLPFRRFALTVAGARGLRYVVCAALGFLYGQKAIEMLRSADRWFVERTWALGLAAGATLAVCLLLWLRRHREGAKAAADGASLV
jgi:membrane protein YqaA with SNARE-associated domain